MTRKITVQDMMDENVGQAEAERIVAKLNKPQPKVITFKTKCTVERANELALANPDLVIVKAYKGRKPKDTAKSAPAKK